MASDSDFKSDDAAIEVLWAVVEFTADGLFQC